MDRPTPPGGVTRLRIQSWAAGGRGIGRVDGRVFMVAGGVPGDDVAARIIKDHGRFVEAIVEEVERPSSARRPPPCPIQASCGGCPLMAVDEASQRLAKRQFLLDALTRIGRLSAGLQVGDVVAAPPALGYRNKIELTFGRDRSMRPLVGYHGASWPSSLIDVEACAVADPSLQPLLAATREFFLEGPGASDPATQNPREPLRLVLRSSEASHERLVALRGLPGPFPSAAAFAHHAAGVDSGLVGVVRLLAAPGRRGGAAVETIAGRAWITEEVHGILFRLPAATFFQVHRAAAERLMEHILERAGPVGQVLELYGGIGAHGLALARRGAAATVIDADPAAIACGIEAARSLGLDSVSLERADVFDYLGRRAAGFPPDLVIADPPRTGLGHGVAERLAALGAERIAMVSCDPATLARDLALIAGRGYRVEQVIPFDLFPQTAHVEAVAWLVRTAGRLP